jgi:hypothetical protein
VPDIRTSSLWIRVRNVRSAQADSNDKALSVVLSGATTLEDVFIPDQSEIPLNKYKAFYWDDTNGTTTPFYTEEIERPVVNFVHKFHNIPGQSFSAYWVGNLKFSKAVTRGIYAMLGRAQVRIIIDKQEVFKGSSDASIIHLFSAGLHKIEVEYSSNYFSTRFDMKVIPEIEYTSNPVLRDALSEHNKAQFWYAGMYDTKSPMNDQIVGLAASDKKVVLFLTAHDIGVWDFSATATERVAAIVLSSYSEGVTLKGIPESVDVYYNKSVPYTRSIDNILALQQFMADTLGITLTGFTGHYSKDSIFIPEVFLDSAK